MPKDHTDAKVMVVGSANMDLVFRCARLPAPGETCLGSDFETLPGGKGANQAAAIGRLGGSVDFVGNVGDDAFGKALLSSLSSFGVRTDRTSILTAAPTGVAAVLVAADGQNSIVVAPGANQELTAAEVTRALADCQPRVVLAQLEIPIAAVEACIGSTLFILNPAPAVGLSARLLSGIHVLTPNEHETEALTGVNPVDDASCRRAVEVLHRQGVTNAVLTLGPRGCFVSDSHRAERFDGLRVNVIDSTAAGDAFNGALAHFLAVGRDLWTAAKLANLVGALSTTVKGAQCSMPTLESLRHLAPGLV